jgi:4-hydroxy-tetrahydrodipicolinate synthase
VQALTAHPNVVAIKESAGNINQLMDLISQTRLQVLSGEDHLVYTTLSLGGHGTIAAAAHLHPELFVAMYEATQQGQWARARELHYQLLPMVRALFTEPNPAVIKAALAQQGMITDELRLPMLPATQRARDAIGDALAALVE